MTTSSTAVQGVIDLIADDGSNAPIELSAYRIYGKLKDVSGAALVKADIVTFTVTVLDEEAGTVVLASTDINDANNCTLTDVSSQVEFSWINTAAAVTANTARRAHFEWTYTGSVAPGIAELRFIVLEDKL